MTVSAARRFTLVHGYALRLCLTTFPRTFRHAYGAALAQTVHDQVLAARQRGLWYGCLVAFAELTNLMTQGVLMRFRAMASGRHASKQQRRSTQRIHHVMLDPIRQDMKQALRSHLRRPWSAIGTISLLAVGIGLTTTMFGLVDSYLLGSLPFPEADELVTIRPFPPGSPAAVRATAPGDLDEVVWPNRDHVIQDILTWDLDTFTLTGNDRPEMVTGAWVPPGYLRTLRTTPALGRLFTDADGVPGAENVAILGYDLWQRRYGGNPSVIGQTISAYAGDRPFESETFTIVGVLPRDFWFVNSYTEMLANLKGPRTPYMLRLTPGTSKEQAAAHLTGIVRAQLQGISEDWPGMYVESTHELYVQTVRPILVVLTAAAGFVLLIACGNVALLLTVRAFGRQREISVRRALGASRFRVAKQLAAEGIILSGAACVAGVVLAWGILDVLGPAIQEQLRTSVPGGVEGLTINIKALTLAVVLSLLTGIIFAVVPAMASTRGSLADSMRESSLSSSDTRRRQITRNVVIGAEMATSLILSIGAALMLRSAINLHRVELGFEADNVLTANITLRQRSYPESGDLTTFVDRYLVAVRRTPGIVAAAVIAGWPFQDRVRGPVTPEGRPTATPVDAVAYVVGTDFFRTLSVPVVQGRTFDARDRAESEPVVIISESLASSLWPSASAVGQRVRLGVEGDDAPWRHVVGVVGDVRETLTGEESPDTYLPYAQSPHPFVFVMTRVTGDPMTFTPALDRSLWSIDPDAVITMAQPMSDLVTNQLARPQFLALVLLVFGVMAVLLALTGLYSTIAYAVSQRRRDVAIHMALGAGDRHVTNIFLRNAAAVIAAGVVVGLAGTLALTRVLTSQLYGVTALDTVTYVATIALLLSAALMASWFPARHAATTDPMRVLRDE